MTAREVVTGALRDLRRSWRSLALTDIACKLLAFALLTPATTMLLHWLMSRAGSGAIADADIARFFLTTRAGVVALVACGALLLAIVALEAACLMAIGLAEARGGHLSARDALVFGGVRALDVLRLTAQMVVRVLAGLVPFLAAGGVAYWALLRRHDINYYLSHRPPEFWAAAALGALIAAGLAALLAWTTARWALALPLVLFEDVSPRRALGESARRSAGNRWVVVTVLAAWAAAALALTMAHDVSGPVPRPQPGAALRRLAGAAPRRSSPGWRCSGPRSASRRESPASRSSRCSSRGSTCASASPATPRHPQRWRCARTRALPGSSPVAPGRGWRPSRSSPRWVSRCSRFLVTRTNQPVLVIAHRGSSAAAPENTLAAFRLAAEQGADFVELDVQESADGEVLVVHDSDLMKVGGAALKIWETDAATLRTVDIGSRAGPQFSGERVPTLAEALSVCKGRTRVIVELKSYGHDERLEERVAAIVEAAGMENDCIFMSLDRDMVRKMKQTRPSWRSGLLVAKGLGDLTVLGADFLAVEARMATRRFVRRAHRAGQEVYVWTVDDPAWMLDTMGRGVDGLITNRPDLAREVVARRARMSDAQRLLVALMVGTGARSEALESEAALRP